MACEFPPGLLASATIEELNEKRREAVRLRLMGTSLTGISQLTGLTKPTIIGAYRAFIGGGWEGVSMASRGRRDGDGRLISSAAEASILRKILDFSPDQLELAFQLWDAKTVVELVRRETGITLARRSAMNYLRRWGFSLGRPNAVYARKLVCHEGATVEAGRTEVAAEVHWLRELRICVRAEKANCCVIGAVNGLGQCLWKAYGPAITEPDLDDFLECLLERTQRDVVVLVDGLDDISGTAFSRCSARNGNSLHILRAPTAAAEANLPRLPAAKDMFSEQIRQLIANSAVAPAEHRRWPKKSTTESHMEKSL